MAFKILCFLLCVVFTVLTAVSSLGACALVAGEVYIRDKDQMVEDCKLDIFRSQSMSYLYYVLLEQTDFDFVYNYYGSYRPFGNLGAVSPDNTNLRYKITDKNGNILSQNTEFAEADVCDMHCIVRLEPDENGAMYFGVTQIHSGEWSAELLSGFASSEDVYIVSAYLAEGLPAEDEYKLMVFVFDAAYALKYHVWWIAIASLVLAIISFITLMCIAGRRPKSEELHPGPFSKIPFDILLAIAFGIGALLVLLINELDYSVAHEIVFIGAVFLCAVVALNVLLGLCISAAVRIKQGTIFKNTLVFMLLALCWKIIKWIFKGIRKIAKRAWALIGNISIIWRTALVVLGLIFFNIIVISQIRYGSGGCIAIAIIEFIVLGIAAMYTALFMRKLQKGGEAIANGDLTYKTDTKMMFGDFKKHGENLNSISRGMTAAVDKRLQSERMKTELITNVSHDIKTPLTSIINYASLISQENCSEAQRKEYADVLVRKSEHLKRLLDDLVEASKASTGNLEVSLLPCDAGVLLEQAAGEFEQRCANSGLQLVVSRPENDIRIMLDSRRIWRVFENLMSNACKYSLQGSRVYLSLEEKKGEAVFTLRNTSRSALNISPDELMERFVRGDSSRSTEGNGLGLSIARSLTELQGGRMDIAIDGDLFKVTLRFPVIE